MVPYSSVSVTAWRHGTDKGLAEVSADKDGKYCIEVPTDAKTVDLRVWGLEFFQGNNYVCEGSADSVNLGSISGKCGSGTCLKVDIHAECRERAMRNRGFWFMVKGTGSHTEADEARKEDGGQRSTPFCRRISNHVMVYPPRSSGWIPILRV
jgi:hypothetical protein